MATAAPRGEQAKDLDFLLNIGQIFTQIVYAQLVAEAAALDIDGAPGGHAPEPPPPARASTRTMSTGCLVFSSRT